MCWVISARDSRGSKTSKPFRRDQGPELCRGIPADTAQQLAVAEHGEWLAVLFFGTIDYLAVLADRNHPVEAEGTPDHPFLFRTAPVQRLGPTPLRTLPEADTRRRGNRLLPQRAGSEAGYGGGTGAVTLSLVSEFIENGGREYDKQGCELKGFYRMTPELKRRFPKAKTVLQAFKSLLNKSLLLKAPARGSHRGVPPT